MDTLVQHCIRELSFEGDYGCTISRFKAIVEEFYAQQTHGSQLVDDNFIHYISSLLMSTGQVSVGLCPPDSPQVSIAPNPTASARKRKRRASNDEDDSGNNQDEVASRSGRPLKPINENEKSTSTQDLCAKYGSSFRIAANPSTMFRILTGSHSRPSKMTDMAYTVLKLVACGRSEGYTVDEMAKTSKYSSGSMFHLVKSLEELELVHKVHSSGISKNRVVHRYFWEHSAVWQNMVAEEKQAQTVSTEIQPTFPQGGSVILPDADGAHYGDLPDEDDEERSQQEIDEAVKEAQTLEFDPLDPLTLGSFPIVAARVNKLLNNCANHTHVYVNALLAIGCQNPTRADRRLFRRQIINMERRGYIERILVPSKKFRSKSVICIRPATGVKDVDVKGASHKGITSESLAKWNVTIHRQLTEIVNSLSPRGRTHNEMMALLGQFDVRTLEHLIKKNEEHPLPHHLRHLAITSEVMHYGRECRTEYWTKSVLQRSQLDPDTVTEKIRNVLAEDLSDTAGFAEYNQEDFYYGDLGILAKFVDNFGITGKRSRPSGVKLDGTARNRNPILPDGSVKKGRPRKERSVPANIVNSGEKTEAAPPKKRGRAPKDRDAANSTKSPITAPTAAQGEGPSDGRRRRGRSAKRNLEVMDSPASGKGASRAISTKGNSSGSQQLDGNNEQPPLPDEIETVPSPLANRSLKRPAGDHDDEVIPNKRLKANKAEGPKSPLAPLVVHSANPIPPDLAQPPLDDVSSSGVSANQHNPQQDSTQTSSQKRMKASRKVNLTALRRQEEVLAALEDLGGIVHLSDNRVYDQFQKVIKKRIMADVVTSTPEGMSLDPRTMNKTVASLRDRGRVTLKLVMLPTRRGTTDKFTIVHLVDADPEAVNAFIASLGNYAQPNKLTLPKVGASIDYVEAQTNHEKTREKSRSMLKAIQTGIGDFRKIREDIFTERRVIDQSLGFLVGRFARTRELHLFVSSQIEKTGAQANSRHFVSICPPIFSTKYLWEDAPIGTYCALVPPLRIDEEVVAFMSDHQNKWIPCSEAPTNIKRLLGVGNSKCRKYIKDTLLRLRELGVMTPLVISHSTNPFISCPPNPSHPTSFDLQHDTSGFIAYWSLNTSAPVWLFRDAETKSPYVLDQPMETMEQRIKYWQLLHDASVPSSPAFTLPVPMPPMPFRGDSSISLHIRRSISWSATYILAKLQRDFLSSCLDTTSGTYDESNLPFWQEMTGAPSDAIMVFMNQEQTKLQNEKQRLLARRSRMRPEPSKVLSLKIAETKMRLEKEWEELLDSVRHEPIPDEKRRSLVQWREAFIDSGGLSGLKRKAVIVRGIENILNINKPVVMKELINKFRSRDVARPLPDKVHPKKREERKEEKGQGDRDTTAPKSRRRFGWNDDFDELARDAGIIIKARCRHLAKPVWGSLSQVFPDITRHSARIRVSKVLGGSYAAYAKRLEAQWMGLWLKYRGSSDLPDEYPDDPVNFDLGAHIDFLRRHIDKGKLRAGISDEGARFFDVALPKTIDLIDQRFGYTEYRQLFDPTFDYFLTAVGDEIRETTLTSDPFIMRSEQHTSPIGSPRVKGLAQAAVKMTISTPENAYDDGLASTLLEQLGDAEVADANETLRMRDVLAFSNHDPSLPRPGRGYRYHDTQSSAIFGVYPNKIYRDAVELEDELLANDENSWNEWPFLAADGTTAALLSLVSDGKVELEIEHPSLEETKGLVAGNSKKIDDDHMEPLITYRTSEDNQDRFLSTSPSASPDSRTRELSPMEDEADVGLDFEHAHGVRSDGHQAACGLHRHPYTFEAIVDCEACIFKFSRRLLITSEMSNECHEVLNILRDVGEAGISKVELLARVHASPKLVVKCVKMLTSTSGPLAFWVGYAEPAVLVASQYVSAWAIKIPIPPIETPERSNSNSPRATEPDADGPRGNFTYVFPRRWKDVHGRLLQNLWDAVLKAVMSHIWLRPGVCERDIFSRLGGVYDAPEIRDALKALLEDGFVRRWFDEDLDSEALGLSQDLEVGIGDLQEKMTTFWAPGNLLQWYRV